LQDTEVSYTPIEDCAINAVAIMNEEAWRLSIPGATFHNLLCRPFGARVRRHVDVENLPAGVIDQQEDVECPKEDRLDAEEIARGDGRCVSLQE